MLVPKTDQSSILSIEPVDATHAGLFNFTVNNAAGIVSHTTNLVVKGANKNLPFLCFRPINLKLSYSKNKHKHFTINFYCPSSTVDNAVQFR